MKSRSFGCRACFSRSWIFFLMLAGIAIGCNPTQSDPVSTSGSDVREVATDHRAASGPREVVKEFMKLVKAKENDKANALFANPNSVVHGNRTGNGLVEGVPRLDWVQVLQERGFGLKDVLEETTEHDNAKVLASLYVEDLKDFRQEILFTLKKTEGRWLISDMQFVFGEKERQLRSTI